MPGRAKLPIRRRSHPSPASTMNSIRQEIETYALMFPTVSFTLEATNRSHDGSPSKNRILKVPKVMTIHRSNARYTLTPFCLDHIYFSCIPPFVWSCPRRGDYPHFLVLVPLLSIAAFSMLMKSAKL